MNKSELKAAQKRIRRLKKELKETESFVEKYSKSDDRFENYFKDLPKEGYEILLIDPPWSYRDKANSGKRGAEHKYPCMKIKDIREMPVNQLAADNAMLFMWVTMPFLFEPKEILEYWGFDYVTNGFNWVKTNKVQTDTLFWGMGSHTRACGELCILARKGKGLKRQSASVHSVVIHPIGRHSAKPEVVRERIEELYGPDVNRIELFARGKAPEGWAFWGNEAE